MKNRTSILRPLALSFLMALPFGLLIGFLAVGAYEGWEEIKREVYKERTRQNYYHRSLAFLSDGTPVVHVNSSNSHNDYSHLDGARLSPEEQKNVVQAVYVRLPRNRQRHPFDREPFEGLLSNRNRWYVFNDPVNRSIHWTWEALPDDSNRRMLVSKYQRTGVPISYVVPEGFFTEKPQSGKGFASPDSVRSEATVITFRSAGQLIAIDVSDRTVKTICEASDKGWEIVRRDNGGEYQIVVRSSNSLEVYSKAGERMFEFSDPTGHSLSPDFYPLSDGGFVITRLENSRQEKLSDGKTKYLSNIVVSWLNETGEETRSLEFQNEYMNEFIPSDSVIVRSVDWFMDNVGQGLIAPEPAVMCGVVFVLGPWANYEMHVGKTYQEGAAEILGEIPYAIPVSAIVALVCSVLCWKRQVRYQADWTKTWVVFVFLFGLPAWIAWRVHRRWPPVELATISENEFVGPELNGLEIR